MARYPIHVPYLVNRVRADDPKKIRDTVNAILEELHRFLRYLQDSNDNTQTILDELTGEGPDSVPTLAEMHAKIMIRVSLDF